MCLRLRFRYHRPRRKLFTASIVARTLDLGFIVLPEPPLRLPPAGYPGRPL